MAIDPHELLVARVNLELELHPSPDISPSVEDDLRLFLGDDSFERFGIEQALNVLAQDDDSVAVNLLRADAILDVFAAEHQGVLTDDVSLTGALTNVASALLGGIDDPRETSDLLNVFDVASTYPSREERWAYLKQNADHILSQSLLGAPHGQCVGHKVPYGTTPNEYVAQISTEVTVAYGDKTIDDMATNLVPGRWAHCNKFFCSMTFRPDLVGNFPGALLVDLQPTDSNWRGVYLEKVGSCPNGSLSNVFLGVDWARRPDALALTYQLLNVPGHPSDVEVDKGYVTVATDADGFAIKTLKLLRFSRASGYSDGHSLGLLACAMGWLDIVVHMVACDQAMLPADPSLVGPSNSATSPDTEAAYRSECADTVRDRVNHYADRFDKAIKHFKSSDSPSADATSLAAGLGIQMMGDVVRGALEAYSALRKAAKGVRVDEEEAGAEGDLEDIGSGEV